MDTYYYFKILTDNSIRVEHQSSPILRYDDICDAIEGLPELILPRAPLPLNGAELRMRVVYDGQCTLKQLPLNPVASGLYGAPVFGEVILCADNTTADEDDMDLRAFTQNEYESILNFLTTILIMFDWFDMRDKVVLS